MLKDRSSLIAEIPHLRRYALALVRNPDGADDLVQNCLERALNKFHLWQSDRDLRPWLFSMMHNLYIDTVRHQSRRGASVALSDAQDLPSHSTNQEDRLNATAVLNEIDRLPQNHKDVLILIGINELSYAQAAKVLGIPTGTLMSRLNRARVSLRKNLNMETRKSIIRRVK